MNRSSIGVGLMAVVLTVACGPNLGSPAAPTSDSRTPPQSDQNVVIDVAVQFYAGAPVPDPDYCFGGCPADVVIPAAPDGVYRMRSGVQHTADYVLWLKPAACCVSGEVTYDWSDVVSPLAHKGPPSVGMGGAIGFIAPPADGTVHYITFSASAGTARSTRRIAVEGIP